MPYNDDKRELLKLKQGLIDESESEIAGAVKETPQKPKGKKAVENFFYHYKIHLLVIAFFLLAGGYLTYDTLTREKEDIRFLTIATGDEGSTVLSANVTKIEEAVEFYTPDFDNNGYVHSANFFININPDGVSPDFYYGNRGKLTGEVQDGTARIFIGDTGAFDLFGEEIAPEFFFVDLESRYPNNPNVFKKYFYKIEGTEFAEKAGISSGDIFIAVRLNYSAGEKVAENTRRALEVADGIMGK